MSLLGSAHVAPVFVAPALVLLGRLLFTLPFDFMDYREAKQRSEFSNKAALEFRKEIAENPPLNKRDRFAREALKMREMRSRMAKANLIPSPLRFLGRFAANVGVFMTMSMFLQRVSHRGYALLANSLAQGGTESMQSQVHEASNIADATGHRTSLYIPENLDTALETANSYLIELASSPILFSPSLILPDPSWVMPMSITGLALLNVYATTPRDDSSVFTRKQAQIKIMRLFSQGVSWVMLVISMMAPSIMCEYWMCSNAYTLVKNLVLRKYLR